MSKEQDEIRAEIFQGEPICGDCIHFGIIEITGYVFDGCKIKEEIVNENAFCKFDPTRFEPSHGKSAIVKCDLCNKLLQWDEPMLKLVTYKPNNDIITNCFCSRDCALSWLEQAS